MTTREIYFKNKYLSGLPIAFITFVTEAEPDKFKIDNISMCYDEDDDEDNIKMMSEIEELDGFKCWVNTPEFDEFWKTYKKHIAETLKQIVLKQR